MKPERLLYAGQVRKEIGEMAARPGGHVNSSDSPPVQPARRQNVVELRVAEGHGGQFTVPLHYPTCHCLEHYRRASWHPTFVLPLAAIVPYRRHNFGTIA